MRRNSSAFWNFLLMILCIVLFAILVFFLVDNKRDEGAIKEGLENVAQEGETSKPKKDNDKSSTNEDTSTEDDTNTSEEKDIKVEGISVWGDEFLPESEAETYSYPAVLQSILEENGYELGIERKMLSETSSMTIMKMAGVSEDIIEDYIESHKEKANGATLQITETKTRDLTADALVRNDDNYIPVIFMGYHGGWNRDLDELIEQQQRILDTFDTNKDKFIIVGLPPADNSVSREEYDAAMEEQWGEHYMSALDAAAPSVVASHGGQSNIAQGIYKKLVNLGYIVKE